MSNDNDGTNLTRPAPEQAAWQDLELGVIYHLDLNIINCTKPEGYKLTPDDYTPELLDTDQWMEAAKAMGAKYAIFTAKQASGFLQWQSDACDYTCKQSKWRDGKGDVVRDFTDSCRRAGIKPGIYHHVCWNPIFEVAHPGLVNWGQGGDDEKQKRYIAMCDQMLTELWSNYGEMVECWFDGSALPPEKGGPHIAELAERYQPNAVFFQSPISSVRWIGNEDGVAGYPCWATVPDRETIESGRELRFHGDPDGAMWMPGECDVPMPGHGWDWCPDQDPDIKPLDELMNIYYKSVGRNANLLLNVTPNPDGLVPEGNLKHYADFGREIQKRVGTAIAETSGDGSELTLELPQPAKIDHVVIMEDIIHGERVRAYTVEGLVGAGEWKTICDGISIGHKRIEQIEPVEVAAVRFRATESVAQPKIKRLAVFGSE